jgi:hypothetical protein
VLLGFSLQASTGYFLRNSRGLHQAGSQSWLLQAGFKMSDRMLFNFLGLYMVSKLDEDNQFSSSFLDDFLIFLHEVLVFLQFTCCGLPPKGWLPRSRWRWLH